jgi:hypothetical protein
MGKPHKDSEEKSREGKEEDLCYQKEVTTRKLEASSNFRIQ